MTRTKAKRKQKISGWREQSEEEGYDFPDEFPCHLVPRMPPHVRAACKPQWGAEGDFLIDGVLASAMFCRHLIAQGENPNKKIPSSLLTPLHVATRSASKKEKDSILFAHSAKNSFPLHQLAIYARTQGASSFIRELLKKGADPTRRDAQGNTPVHYAAFPAPIGVFARVGALEELLDHEGVDPNVLNREGNSPLHLSSNYEVVRALLVKGADPSKKNAEGNTLLHLLFRCPKWPFSTLERIVGLLLDHQADANALNAKGETPLHVLLHRGSHFVEGCVSVVRKMAQKGALDLSLRDEKGRTFYEIATHRFRTGFDTYRLLMLLGSYQKENKDLFIWEDLTNADGMTPLHFLASSLHAPTIEEHVAEMRRVLKCGVRPDARDKDSHTALAVAAGVRGIDTIFGTAESFFFPDLPLLRIVEEEETVANRLERQREFGKIFVGEVVRFLLVEARADPNYFVHSPSPLHVAAASPFYSGSLIESFLEAGADCSLPDPNGCDPLVVLLRLQQPPPALVEKMLIKGVSTRSLGKKGALACLVESFRSKWIPGPEWPEYVRVLLEHGACPDTVTPRGPILRVLLESLTSCVRWRLVREILVLLVEWGVDLQANFSSSTPQSMSSYSFSFPPKTYAEVVCRALGRHRPLRRARDEEEALGIEPERESVGEDFYAMVEILVGAGLSKTEAELCKSATRNGVHPSFSEEDRADTKEWLERAFELLDGAFVCSIKGARRR